MYKQQKSGYTVTGDIEAHGFCDSVQKGWLSRENALWLWLKSRDRSFLITNILLLVDGELFIINICRLLLVDG
jgi:hypothetical protein